MKYTPNRKLTCMIIVAILLGFILAGSCAGLVSLIQPDIEVEGISPSNTIFSNLVGNNGCIPSFQMQEMIVYDPTYRIDSTLWDMTLISSSDAIKSAIEFLKLNINESALKDIHIEWCDLVGNRPTWACAFEGPNLSTALRVNAISGEVIGWTLSSLGAFTPNPYFSNNSRITAHIAESIAYTFLEMNNYSIPASARYLGAQQFHYEPSGLHFYMIFKHYEEHMAVGTYPFSNSTIDGITIKVHENLGIVTYFSYRWTEVGEIPINGLISEYDAQDIALRNYSTNASVVGRQLILSDMFTHYSIDGSPQMRLAWHIVILTHASDDEFEENIVAGYRTDLLVDALSAEFLEARHTNSYMELPKLSTFPTIRVYYVLAYALILSVFMFVTTRWFFLKRISRD